MGLVNLTSMKTKRITITSLAPGAMARSKMEHGNGV